MQNIKREPMATRSKAEFLHKAQECKMEKKKKITKKIKKKQKILAWVAIIITAINFLLAVAFIVYLHFWVKAR